MFRLQICLFTAFLFVTAMVNAQQKQPVLGFVKMATLSPSPTKNYINIFQVNNVAISSPTDSSKIKFAPSGISSTYYTEHLGMMCKEELKLEKAIKIPLRIRLGSKDEVDYLEGKYNRH